MNFTIDAQARYSTSHEWVRMEGGVAVVGVSDYAQHQLSDVVYVELPEVGDTLTRGQSFGTFESVKAAEEIYAPISGEVVEINADLIDNPALVNTDPYGSGWLVKVRPTDLSEMDTLQDAETYEATLASV